MRKYGHAGLGLALFQKVSLRVSFEVSKAHDRSSFSLSLSLSLSLSVCLSLPPAYRSACKVHSHLAVPCLLVWTKPLKP